MKRFLFVLSAIVLVLVAVVAIRTTAFQSRQKHFKPLPKAALDQNQLGERLAASIRAQTISHYEREKNSLSAFQALHATLRRNYPTVFQKLKVETVGKFSLLIEWPGKDAKLKPILLLAHQDVVPVAPGTENEWKFPAFSGQVAEGFVWGRGAIDDKASLCGILEAAEKKLKEGFQPERTVFFAFGEDEEVGGAEGAGKIASKLQARGLDFESILDEGGIISEGMVPDVVAPVSLVGIAEKGYVSIELIAKAKGGHSSIPPRKTAIGRLARAIVRLQARPFSAEIQGPLRQMLETIGPEMGLRNRMALSNLWLFGPLVRRQLAANPASNASIRTTIAPTILQAGEKDNVLPATARAVINFRILPGENTHTVVAHVREAIDDSQIELKSNTHGEASPISPTDSQSYSRLEQTIREVFPDTIVTPQLTVAGTDTKQYSALSRHIWRFLPVRFDSEDMGRFHGTNERLSLAGYADVVRFYLRYLEVASGT